MTEVTVSQVIEETADYIEKQGWCQGAMVDLHEHVCTLGGLTFSTLKGRHCGLPQTFPPLAEAKLVVAQAIFAQQYPDEPMMDHPPDNIIASWNDDKGRTEQEVLDFLRATAKEQRILEEGG